ncbi:MAG TPA: hypothetical protein VE528_05110, partial [Thermoleophilaceae bacterium]|nr:hypothetical protein [Thermoleophilaceae bacterium]
MSRRLGAPRLAVDALGRELRLGMALGAGDPEGGGHAVLARTAHAVAAAEIAQAVEVRGRGARVDVAGEDGRPARAQPGTALPPPDLAVVLRDLERPVALQAEVDHVGRHVDRRNLEPRSRRLAPLATRAKPGVGPRAVAVPSWARRSSSARSQTDSPLARPTAATTATHASARR